MTTDEAREAVISHLKAALANKISKASYPVVVPNPAPGVLQAVVRGPNEVELQLEKPLTVIKQIIAIDKGEH